MALTKDQFKRLYDKGLSVDQIVAFEKGQTPATMQPQQTPEKGFFRTMIEDPIKTLLVKPADRFAEVLGRTGIFGKNVKAGYEQMADEGQGRDFAGINVEAQKGFDNGGMSQIVGDAAKAGSYLYGGGNVGGAVNATLKGQMLKGAIQGAKIGGVGGGLYSFGDAIQEADAQPADVAFKTLFGATAGAVTGGTLGAIAPVVVKGVGVYKRFTNINQVNQELRTLNEEVFRPTKTQLKNFGNHDTLQTYTDIFGTDLPKVDKNNRFTKESAEEFAGRVQDIYQPASDAFNTILRNSPEVNSLTEMEQLAIKNLERENLKPSQLQQGRAKITDEFNAIRLEAKQNGLLVGDDSIPVWYTDSLKDGFWGATKNFGTEESTLANAVNRSSGFALKDGIESVITDLNVKNYNKKLGDLIVLRDFLQDIAGKQAGTGGKMTRLIAGRLSGTLIGSGGGIPGMIAGNLTGDVLARMLIDPELQPYRWLIKKKLGTLPQAEIARLEQEAIKVLEQMARKRAETLRLPAPSTIYVPPTTGTPNPAGFTTTPVVETIQVPRND